MHDIAYVYVCDSSSSNVGVLLRVVDKLYPVTQRQHALLHLLLSHFPFARGWKPREMTSQVVGKSACYKWPSYVIGYRKYKSVWSATVGETLRLTTELINPQDPFAVAVIKYGCVVGQVSRKVGPNRLLFSREGRERRLL